MIQTDFANCIRVASIALSLTGGNGALACSDPDSLSAPASKAIEHFAAGRTTGYGEYLQISRPERLPAEARSQILASPPEEGEVQPSEKDELKLAAIRRIIAYHDRTGAIDIKVIRVPQALIGFHARSVLLISKPALGLLSEGELQALAAHELGHDYFWDEYEQARRELDTRRIQELELRCDGVAVITLVNLGLNPESLLSALARITGFNERFGKPSNQDYYVSDKQRTRFIKTMADLVETESAQRQRAGGLSLVPGN